jgi:hypothetical protein
MEKPRVCGSEDVAVGSKAVEAVGVDSDDDDVVAVAVADVVDVSRAVVEAQVTTLRDRAVAAAKMAAAARRRQAEHLNGRTSMPNVRRLLVTSVVSYFSTVLSCRGDDNGNSDSVISNDHQPVLRYQQRHACLSISA